MSFDSTYVKIDLDIIAANFAAVKAKAGVDVMAVVKADAYGHGAIQVARLLQEQCAFFGVSSILEALELRQAGLEKPILILGYTPISRAHQLHQLQITQTVYSYEYGKKLSDASFKEFDCYVFGNEARGVPRDALTAFNAQPFSITGAGVIESLNLASAVNMCVYELCR